MCIRTSATISLAPISRFLVANPAHIPGLTVNPEPDPRMKVVMIAVTSLDGRITRPGEAGAGFASPEDQAWFHTALGFFDCSVMGRKTFETIPPEALAASRSSRLRVVLSRDASAHTPTNHDARVEFTSERPEQIVAGLRERGLRRCAVLGGGQIYRLFLESGCVDAVWLTLEPVFLGAGTSLVDGAVREIGFNLDEVRPLSSRTLLLNYGRPDGEGVPLPKP